MEAAAERALLVCSSTVDCEIYKCRGARKLKKTFPGIYLAAISVMKRISAENYRVVSGQF